MFTRIKNDQYFSFGKNWKRYLKSVGRTEIEDAKLSISVAIERIKLEQFSFLDIGSGSGLFSRAAYELGAACVISFDLDENSVETTNVLKQGSGATDTDWKVMQGSVLDREFMHRLGQHDLVYSWGVLHHTGDMWQAIDNAAAATKLDGLLFIALYNDQGWISRYWYAIKRFYVASPKFVRLLMLLIFWVYFGIGLFMADLLRGRNPLRRHIGDSRGMKFFTDVIDWIGGFPFEVAKPKAVVDFMAMRGFETFWQRNVGRRHGCNEFVFRRRVKVLTK